MKETAIKEALELLLQMSVAHVISRVEFKEEDWLAAFTLAQDALREHTGDNSE